MSEDAERGTGRTIKQMKEAPKDAYYVWCNDRLDYPTWLKRQLGRDDLRLVRPSELNDIMPWRASSWYPGLVLDHACQLTSKQREVFCEVQARVLQR